MIYIHKKTGKCYRMLAHAVDCTNSRSPSPMIVYCPDDNEHSIFVREEGEFRRRHGTCRITYVESILAIAITTIYATNSWRTRAL